MRPIEFYRNASGQAMVRGTDTALVAFLSTDCQGSTAVMDDVLLLTAGDKPAGEFIGNAHQLDISPDRVLITPLYGANDENTHPRTLSVGYFRATLTAWRRYVSPTEHGFD